MNSYESQLTPDQLHQLRAALSEPAPNMLKIQAQAPPWHQGPYAGSPPSLPTLYTLADRLRSECLQAETQSTTDLLHGLQATLLAQPDFTATSPQAINQTFSLLCHEIIRRTLYQDDSKTRIYLLRLLLRFHQLLLQKARFQRLAAEKFEQWYQNGPLQQRLAELDNATSYERIQAIGRAMFGQDWHPEWYQPYTPPGLTPAPNTPPTTNHEPPNGLSTTNSQLPTTENDPPLQNAA